MASPVTSLPVRSSSSRSLSASGISKPWPREAVCPSIFCKPQQKAERTCTVLPSSSLLARSVLPSMATWRSSLPAAIPAAPSTAAKAERTALSGRQPTPKPECRHEPAPSAQKANDDQRQYRPQRVILPLLAARVRHLPQQLVQLHQGLRIISSR